ncbi:hypothetical protein GF312_22255 [Candidatus Poribacteria bacterium]|nr:hypothetical protein [Candidatus Poribacteria bacterium]
MKNKIIIGMFILLVIAGCYPCQEYEKKIVCDQYIWVNSDANDPEACVSGITYYISPSYAGSYNELPLPVNISKDCRGELDIDIYMDSRIDPGFRYELRYEKKKCLSYKARLVCVN